MRYVTNISNQSKVRVDFIKPGFLIIFMIASLTLEAGSPASNDTIATPNYTVDNTIENTRGWYSTSLYGEFGLPTIQHSVNQIGIDDQISFGGGLSFNFRFVDWLGIQFGAGLSYHNTNLNIPEYNAEIASIDNEGDSYTKIVSARNVMEEQKWLWLNAPVSLNFFYGFGDWELYGLGGIEMRYAILSDYTQTGTFTHQGYYEQWNVLFDDLPSLGFYTDRNIKSEGKIEPDLLLLPYFGIGMITPGQNSRFYMEFRYYLNSQDPLANSKQDGLFPGPENNQSVNMFSNKSVLNFGDVAFGGLKFIVGINF
ncbi:hypothetical protein [Alkalitalea saponilacus]|uniref:Outer membrane protein beta-barrel domain-containing protein n=1 Tax=Alkalitalea saponilacus TaxID=889453 RepID=A0A1T5EW33_9BACT|nr:hypothetical protein [Alkalitalea saponilacus]ASB48007.1 hypothetical protein CDL62_01980 [Alkalitalea saponilacus]SKB88029.1 hypothetical protein SAMN03080601_01419 [Alkalitalea saponilacus]